MGFNVGVTVKSPDGTQEKRTLELKSAKNLFAIVKKLFPEMKFRIDKKFGAEVSAIGKIKKTKRSGLHFTIDGDVPVATDPETMKKLYLSLYHVQADKNMNIIIELVSVSCDYANSVIEPRLQLRFGSDSYWLESLPSATGSISYRTFLPRQPPLLRYDWSGHYLYKLSQLYRNFDGAKPVKHQWEQVPDFRQKSPDERPSEAPEYSFEDAQIPMPVQGQVNHISYHEVLSENILLTSKNIVLGGNRLPVMSFAGVKHATQKEQEPTPYAPLPKQSSLICSDIVQKTTHYSKSMGSRIHGSLERGGTRNESPTDSMLPISYQSTSDSKPTEAPSSFKPASAGSTSKTSSVSFKPVPLSSLKRFTAAIFDLDGVIVDSEHAHLETFNAAFAKFGVKVSSAFWKRNYTGIGSRSIVKDVFAKNGITMPVDEMVQHRSGMYQKYVEKHGLPAMPFFAQTLALLKSEGVKVIVASGGHRSHVQASLDSVGVSMPFVGHEDVERHKPAPDTFLLAAEKLGIPPSECLVFEDSLSGVKAAAAAGMPCIALATTLPTKELAGKAALVVNGFYSPKLKSVIARLLNRKGISRRKKGRALRYRKSSSLRPAKRAARKRRHARRRA